MRSEAIAAAKSAANAFLLSIDVLEKAQPKLYMAHYAGRCKESANVRRKSMDLTRALSEMRKP